MRSHLKLKPWSLPPKFLKNRLEIIFPEFSRFFQRGFFRATYSGKRLM